MQSFWILPYFIGVLVHADELVRADIIGGTPSANVPSYYATSMLQYGLCGAVWIHRKFLLTAAHCCEHTFHRYVVWDGIRFPINYTYVHPLYETFPYQYDLCVIELEKAAVQDINVEPLSYRDSYIPTNASVWTMGYGLTNATDESSISYDTSLHTVQLTVISQDQCRAMYAPISLDHRIVDNNVFCTYDHGVRDACHGDSGSPIVASDNTTLLGIVSWGRDCAGVFPAVHMKIDVDFIDRIVPHCDDEPTTTIFGDHYYDLHWRNDDTCIDLHTNRMVREWKSMGFVCGSCDDASGTIYER